MKYAQTIGIMAAILMVAVCFLPWIYIPSLQLTISGVHGTVNEQFTFGKQILAQSFFSVLLIAFFALPKVWAKRTNLFVGFINMAWAIKNFTLFSLCRAGECPEVKPGLYITVGLAVIVLLMTLLPRLKLPVGSK
ncbi:MAG: hypothetical protein GTN67_03780 [Hydrotalea flava]|uniref:hypothetical protein n=1 Tax=Hydrotalea flava TaxID=714549 RepID=UPI00082A110C|nr:hypothetical protein [Hydrotalea flava]RTL52005.1 MAG: hypothetical protein EKK39_07220 [Sphingobacteriales bacterium]NIM34570.1 hypothetical protein [Hydrotalea flava]NIM37410.1 hypothetical protein [Hydrotalea flava]NIN02595.1 hypothetical protein [Hydrotalea flava]NIN14255.1 hypothetical protein [Hydrotalea flava]